MKYASVFLLAIFLVLGSASTTLAQDRGRGGDDEEEARVIVRDNDRRARGESGSNRGRSDDGRRGRSGDVERERSNERTGDILGSRRDDDDRDKRRERDRGRDRDDDWDDRYDDWDDDDRDERRRRDVYRRDKRKGNGPPFCRSGEGHPVHGREWCREKGWGLGGYGDRYDDYYDDRDWERRRSGDIYFPSRRDRTLGGRVLDEILGRSVTDQVSRRARDLRASGPLRGRWNGNSELRIYAGDRAIGRILDRDGDGRGDVLYLRK